MVERISTKEVLDKYSKKLENALSTTVERDWSKEYETFRAEMVPELSRYEKWAQSLGNVIKLKVSEKDRVKIQGYLDTAHLQADASQALTLALMSMLAVFFAVILVSVGYFLIRFPGGLAAISFGELSD